MKQILLIVTFSIFGFSFSQIKEMDKIEKIEIGKVKDWTADYITIERWGEDEIVVIYKDMKYERINEYKSFSFKDVDGAFDSLYNKLYDGVESKKVEEVSLELPEHILTLDFKKLFGHPCVEIYVQHKDAPSVVGKMMWLDKSRIKGLFGKKEPKKEKKKK